MASRKEDSCLCGPCNMRHLTVDASVWCPECDEGLCERCLEYHAVSKSLKKHLPSPVKSYLELSTFVQTIKQNCESHGESLDLFCPTHQEPCCAECISSQHKNCPGVTLLSKVVQGIKTSEYFSQVEKSIKDIKSNYVMIKQNREVNVKSLEQQRILLKANLQTFRKKLISHLDQLEHKLNDEIDTIITKEINNLQEFRNTINNHQEKLDKVQENLTQITGHGTEIQVYLALRNIEESIIEDTKNLMLLTTTKAMKEIVVDLNITTEFKQLSVANSLGAVQTSENAIGVKFVDLKSEKAQMSIQKCSEQNIKLEFVKSIELPNRPNKINMSSVCVLPDGRMLFVNNEGSQVDGHIYIFDKNGKFQLSVTCNTCPFGIEVISEDKIAVSSYTDKLLYIYDTKTFSVQDKLASGYNHWGLSSNGNELIAAIRGTGISVINTSGKLLKIYPVDYDMLAYVHYAHHRIYYTNFTESILFCLSLDGEYIWEVQFDEMKGPRNICTNTGIYSLPQ